MSVRSKASFYIIPLLLTVLSACDGGISSSLPLTSVGTSNESSGANVQPAPTTVQPATINGSTASVPAATAGQSGFDTGLASDATLLMIDLSSRNNDLIQLDIATGAFSQNTITVPSNWNTAFAWAMPDVVGNRVLVSARDNSINAFNLETGSFLWDQPIGNYGFGWDIGSPVCINQICYTRGAHGVIAAVSALTGNVIWSTDVSDDPGENDNLEGSDPILYNGKIYVATYSTTTYRTPILHVLDATSGSVEMQLNIPISVKPASFGPRVVFNFQPTIVGNILLFSGGDLVAFNADTLQPLWQAGLDGASIPVFSGGLFVTNTLLAGRPTVEQAHVVGIDPLTGEVKWARPAGVIDRYFSSASDGRTVFTQLTWCSSAGLCNVSPAAIDGATGELNWINRDIRFDRIQAPLLAGNALFFGYLEAPENSGWADGLGMLSKLDGSLQWTNSRANDSLPDLVISGDTVYRRPFTPIY